MATPAASVRLEGRAVDLTGEEQAAIDALNAEYAKLEAEYGGADELPDAVDERLGEIEARARRSRHRVLGAATAHFGPKREGFRSLKRDPISKFQP